MAAFINKDPADSSEESVISVSSEGWEGQA